MGVRWHTCSVEQHDHVCYQVGTLREYTISMTAMVEMFIMNMYAEPAQELCTLKVRPHNSG